MAYFNPQLLPPTVKLRVIAIQRTPEKLADLNGLTMDKCDMDSKTYSYRDSQFLHGDLAYKRIRCPDCYVRIYTPAAKKRSRKPTLDEQDASRRAHMIYYDFWPEDKEKPMIVTRGGSLVLRPDDQEGYDAYIEVEDGPPIELNLEIYYPRGEYAKAMDKPRLKIEDSERVRGALVPTWHEKPLLGKEMDPNKPCYTQSAVYRNYEMMEWWSHIVPIRWSEYEELTSGCFSIPKARCIGHPGEVQGHKWTCCGRYAADKGCQHNDCHQSPPEINYEEEEKNWKLYKTPKATSNARDAVALSCETGITTAGDPEVVRVSAVDFFTGEVLVDSLVFPRVRMLHLNSRWSGVQWNMLYNARRNGTVLEGRDAARRKVCNFVGPNTILIMHNGGRKELEHLRWIHERVIDIEELESRRHKSVRLTTWKEGLSKLVRVHLQRKFQGSRLGNDTVETAMALRDLVHWYMNNLEPRMKTKIDSNIVVTEEQMRVAEEYAKKSGTPMVPPDERYRWVIARNFPKDDERYHLYEYQSDDEPLDHDRA